MLLSDQWDCGSMFLFTIMALTKLTIAQVNIVKFRPLSTEIVPKIIVIDSNSIASFVCINHAPVNENLHVKLSKAISSNQMNIITNKINKTTIRIQLISNNYIGIFHLLCYVNGDQERGAHADVIVTAAPGVLQLTERCRVFEKQYVKCRIRAPTLATAIQNDYPPNFEFHEITHTPGHTAYISRVEFLKSESTNEYLMFKWRPTEDGVFPERVRMHMTAKLPHFNVTSYYFDISPVFQIKPTYSIHTISSSNIQIQLTPTNPASFCEQNVSPELGWHSNQTWSIIEANRRNIPVENLLPDSVYRVCIKCRQFYTDPDGFPECQQIKTLTVFESVGKKIFEFLNQNRSTFVIICSVLIVSLIFVCGFCLWKNQREHKYKHVSSSNKKDEHNKNRNYYVMTGDADNKGQNSTNASQINSMHLMEEDPIEDFGIDDDKIYQPISIPTMLELAQQCSPPPILVLQKT